MTNNSGRTTDSNGQSPSDSSLRSGRFSGPFIIEAVGMSVAVVGIIGAVIALVHLAQQA